MGATTDASESSGGTSGDEPFVHEIWSLEGHAEISRDGADWAGWADGAAERSRRSDGDHR